MKTNSSTTSGIEDVKIEGNEVGGSWMFGYFDNKSNEEIPLTIDVSPRRSSKKMTYSNSNSSEPKFNFEEYDDNELELEEPSSIDFVLNLERKRKNSDNVHTSKRMYPLSHSPSTPKSLGSNGIYLEVRKHVLSSLENACNSEVTDRKSQLLKLYSEMINEIDHSRYDVPYKYFYEVVNIIENELTKYEQELSSNSHFQAIFALLWFRQAFKEKLVVPRVKIFLNGCNQLFWSDVTENGSSEEGNFAKKRFRTVFRYLIKTLVSHRLEQPIFDDVFGVALKYFFYYSSKKSCSKVQLLLTRIHQKQKIKEVKKLYDTFVRENVLLLESLESENVKTKLIKKFVYMKSILPFTLSRTKYRLKTELYRNTRETTSKVLSKESERVLDFLFPFGKFPRALMKQLGRLFYTFDFLIWPLVVAKWTIRVFRYFFGLLFVCFPILGWLFKIDPKKGKIDGSIIQDHDDDTEDGDEDDEDEYIWN